MQTKETQGKLWSTSPLDWVTYLEPTFIPLYQAVLKQLKLDEEKMLLDAGCGSGLFLSMASATGVEIHGIDAAPGLLAISRQRLPGITLLSEDLEALPYIDGTFDVVTGFNSFQYAGSFENALAEAARVVKRHGNVVIATWGLAENCEASTIHNAVVSLLPSGTVTTSLPDDLNGEGRMEAICKKAGLKLVFHDTVFCPWQFNSDEGLQNAFLSTASCARAAQFAGEEKVRDTIFMTAQPYSVADGVYFMKNEFSLFITTKI